MAASNFAAHELMTCPYNMSHQVERYKFSIHLDKCREWASRNSSSKAQEKKICPFDFNHHVPEVELDYHVTVCKSRHKFDQERYAVGEGDGQVWRSSAPEAPDVQTEESWDDASYTGYVPEEHIVGKPGIVRKIRGARPSERRAFRMEQRAKYQSDSGAPTSHDAPSGNGRTSNQ